MESGGRRATRTVLSKLMPAQQGTVVDTDPRRPCSARSLTQFHERPQGIAVGQRSRPRAAIVAMCRRREVIAPDVYRPATAAGSLRADDGTGDCLTKARRPACGRA